MDAAEITRRFGLGTGARLSDGPVARGRQGLVWRLETSDGSWAVKQPFAGTSEDDVRAAAAFQEQARAAGVPAPRVVRTPDGSVFADAGAGPVRVYEWVDLLPKDLRLDPRLVGSVVAAVHRVVIAPTGPLHRWYSEPVGAQRWDALVADLRRAGAPFADRLAALRDELVGLESWLEPPGALQTCHCDLWADNVLPTADGGVCVIDWENTGPADPRQELACVLFEFGRGDAGRAAELLDAYAAAGGPARIHGRGDFTMLIAQLGHITEMAAMDWLDPNPRSPDRNDAAEWIGEVLDDPHTASVLEELMAVARAR